MNKEYTIIESNKELTKVDEYQMILSPTIRTFKDMNGCRLVVDKWCLYQTDGITVLTIKGANGTVVSGQSSMVKETFQTIMDLLEKKDDFEIEVIVDKSRKGRTFCNIALTNDMSDSVNVD